VKRQSAIGFALLALGLGGTCLAAEGRKSVVLHAGQLFDGKADGLATKQVIVVQDQRIVDVGSEGSVKIPPGAEEIDLGAATVLPGLIDSHNHMFKVDYTPGDASAAIPADSDPARYSPLDISHCWLRRTQSWTLSLGLRRRVICRAVGR
jgi:hypothetical protein